MSIADELSKLDALRAQGVLSDAEFQRAKQSALEGLGTNSAAAVNRLRRSIHDRWIGGVCGGLAAATGVDSWIWRLVLAMLMVFFGTGFIIYLLMWIFVPAEA